MHLYHCHSTPLKKHIHKGLYGAFIIDPPKPRKPAQELVMVMNGFDTDGDGENNFYAVNGPAFYYARYPIRVLAFPDGADLPREPHRVRPDQLVPPARRLLPLLPHGSTTRFEYTDTVMLCQGERGIIEIDFANTGLFMFHAHQSEFAELGWMGFFNVVE